MDIISLAQTAITLATPFLSKIGDGAAKKIGDDIWSLIKSGFTSNGKNVEEGEPLQIQKQLEEILAKDEEFKIKLEDFIAKNQASSILQNVNNNAAITKQVNINSNSGELNF